MGTATAEDVEVALDALHDAIEAGDAREALRLGSVVKIAIKNGVDPAPARLSRVLSLRPRAPKKGAAKSISSRRAGRRPRSAEGASNHGEPTVSLRH